MKKSFTDKQRRLYGAIGIALLSLFLLLLMVERWTVFLPYSTTHVSRNWLYGFYLLGFLWLCYVRIRQGFRTTARGYISILGGVLLGSWAFGQATYGLISISNMVWYKNETFLCLNVVDNGTAPEGIFSQVYTMNVTIQGDKNKLIRPIRYRYPEIQFRNLGSGDAVQVLARPGWAGYTLEKVVEENRCVSEKAGAALVK
jgi:hypothetical protein